VGVEKDEGGIEENPMNTANPRLTGLPTRMEQGPHRRTEAPTLAEARVGDPRASRDRAPGQRSGALQSLDRQQAARLRPRELKVADVSRLSTAEQIPATWWSAPLPLGRFRRQF
jgi:hypothetical protein